LLRAEIFQEEDGQKVPVKGLLSDFLREKCASYAEPMRSGTPRGEPVGFSAKKYAASLLALTTLDGKSTAKQLGVSHGVLRKWRTEPAFKNLVDKHCKEFADRLLRHVKERITADRKDTEDLLKLPLEELARSQVAGRRTYTEFSDGELYGDRLLNELWIVTARHLRSGNKRIKGATVGDDEVIFSSELLWILDLINRKHVMRTPYMDLFQDQKLPLLRALVKRSIELFVLPNSSKEAYAMAIFFLRGVLDVLEQEVTGLSVKRRR
jgi:hypothetical protein